MEESAFEAVMTGVNVFVFIVALTAGITLMSTVIDMVNYANYNASVGMNGSLAENVGYIEDRTYTAAEVLTYYRKQDDKVKYFVSIDDETSEVTHTVTLTSFITSNVYSTYAQNKFRLIYNGIVEDKDSYTFYMIKN